jgi:hypothetical protein
MFTIALAVSSQFVFTGCLITVFQYGRFLGLRIHWHIYPKKITPEGPFILTTATATLLCRQTSSLLN